MERVLVCDDDAEICKAVKVSLQHAFNCEVITVNDGGDALRELDDGDFQLMFLDLNLPKHYGLDVLKTVKVNHPLLPVIIMTGQSDNQAVIRSMRDGAFDFLKKPFSIKSLTETAEQALELVHKSDKIVLDPAELSDSPSGEIITDSPQMLDILKMIGRVSQSDATVLIQGESGTGKELIARTIYRNSRRGNKPFLAVNCAAIPETLLESELFGYEKGAFTGAHNRRIGKFEMCHGGSIFLDEIGDMSLSTQSKILRIIQQGEFERIGSNQTIKIDVRIIAATNVDLEQAIQEKKFRVDLYYRLKVFSLLIPPLRKRRKDVSVLAKHFIHKYAEKNHKDIVAISPEALQTMQAYEWPGNVRELENCIERAVVVAQGDTITRDDLQLYSPDVEDMPVDAEFPVPDDASLEDVERMYVSRVLDRAGWKMKDAAEVLQIHRNTLHRMVKQWDLKPPVGTRVRGRGRRASQLAERKPSSKQKPKK